MTDTPGHNKSERETTGILKNETIVYFGPEPWVGLWRNRHQLMSRLARHNNVWYVEPHATLRHVVNRNTDHGAGGRSPIRPWTLDPSGVKVFHGPWWLPVAGRVPFRTATLRLYMTVLHVLTGLRHRRPVVWFSRPSMVDYVGKLPAKLTIYHVVDEYSGYGTPTLQQREALARKEAQLLGLVNVVIVVSPTLLQSKSPFNANTYCVPNAVDFDAYAEGQSLIPADMNTIPRPIIGYSGLIAPRLDLELVYLAAAQRPDWSFVFVGHVRREQCRDEFNRLKSLSNVYFLGQKSAVETPAYVRHFDIGMLPYALNLRAQHASPLKLYEYAAASKPIVATDFPAARSFEGSLEIIRDHHGFVAACERHLDEDSRGRPITQNRRFAQNNTWEHRLQEISLIVHNHTRPGA